MFVRVVVGLSLILIVCGMGCKPDDLPTSQPRKKNTSLTTNTEKKVMVFLIRKGKRSFLDEKAREQIVQAVDAVLLSCQDRDKRWIDASFWQKLMDTGTCVHIHYMEAQTFNPTVRPALTLTELLIPLYPSDWHGKLLVKNGDTFYSPFIGCDLSNLEQIISSGSEKPF